MNPKARIRTTLAVTALAPNATVTIPHGLNPIGHNPPDTILPNQATPIVVVMADRTSVTFQNLGSVPETAKFFVQITISEQLAPGQPADDNSSGNIWWQGAGSGGSSGQIVDLGGKQITFYVRDSGNDVTGDGSATNPFLTMQRAASAVPVFEFTNGGFDIDMAGASGTAAPGVSTVTVLPHDYVLPIWFSPQIVEFLSATLTAPMGAGDPSCTVDSAFGYPNSGVILIDGEEIHYLSRTATVFQGLSRGQNGTVAAGHLASATVSTPMEYFTPVRIIADDYPPIDGHANIPASATTSTDAITGQITITGLAGLTVNAYAGKFFLDQGSGFIWPVKSNTANVIVTAATFVVGPYVIYDDPAHVIGTADSNGLGGGMTIVESQCELVIENLRINSGGVNSMSVQISNGLISSSPQLEFCDLQDGINIITGAQYFLYSCRVHGSCGGVFQNGVSYDYCLWDTCTFHQTGSSADAGTLQFFGGIAESCATWRIQRALGSTAGGSYQISGFWNDLATSTAFLCDENGLYNFGTTKITNAVGAAIIARGPVKVYLDEDGASPVGGTGNNSSNTALATVIADDGAHIHVTSPNVGVTVTGSVGKDVKCGTLAATTWAAMPANMYDGVGANATGSRVTTDNP